MSRVQTRGGDAEGGGAAAEPGGGGRGLPVREHAELPAGGLGPAILRTQLRQAAPAEEALGPGQHLQLLSECGQCQQYVLWLLKDANDLYDLCESSDRSYLYLQYYGRTT